MRRVRGSLRMLRPAMLSFAMRAGFCSRAPYTCMRVLARACTHAHAHTHTRHSCNSAMRYRRSTGWALAWPPWCFSLPPSPTSLPPCLPHSLTYSLSPCLPPFLWFPLPPPHALLSPRPSTNYWRPGRASVHARPGLPERLRSNPLKLKRDPKPHARAHSFTHRCRMRRTNG